MSFFKIDEKRKNLLKTTEAFILDMDGTIYLGDRIIPGSREFISLIKRSGKKILYFTNNASKNKNLYLEKLTRLGYEAELDDIVTAGDVTIDYLNKHHNGAEVYLVGTPELEASFIENGIKLTDGKKADIVVSSFDTTLTYEKLEKLVRLSETALYFIPRTQISNCPVENGFIPDSGAICALITASTGKTPKYFGKPNFESAEMMANKCGLTFDKMAVVGDRLYTDIALGKNNGILSILVLSGETMLSEPNIENAADIIADSINDLYAFFS